MRQAVIAAWQQADVLQLMVLGGFAVLVVWTLLSGLLRWALWKMGDTAMPPDQFRDRLYAAHHPRLHAVREFLK